MPSHVFRFKVTLHMLILNISRHCTAFRMSQYLFGEPYMLL